MLVLTRRSNQSIVIGTDVVITVLEIHGDSVRIGVDAPRSVQVHRSEVFEAVQEANRAAAQTGKPSLGALGDAAAGLRNRQSAPQAAAPKDSAPKDSAPKDSAPKDSAPEK